MSETKLTWPERLVLRDTKVFADEGQRIFSTATGYDYEKREYVRADAVDEMVAALRSSHKFLCELAPSNDPLIDMIEAALSRATPREGE